MQTLDDLKKSFQFFTGNDIELDDSQIIENLASHNLAVDLEGFKGVKGGIYSYDYYSMQFNAVSGLNNIVEVMTTKKG